VPEPLSRDDIARWRNELDVAAEAMLDQLRQLRTTLPPGGTELAERLIGARDTLFRAVRSLIPPEVAAVKTRCHGDYHLGQVIAVQNDFYIIDFEGEPLRPIEERRRKTSPLRDVAGMIRSFDYAATAAVRQLSETRPAAMPRMAELADAWRERAVDGFRAAYRKAMRGCAAYPGNKLHARALIDWFTLEKAVYEVSYELANRPGWVAIPLNGILRILAKVTGSPHGEAH
jgi:maltose alpha-D-glucosyltransferase/alpha-amylase